MQRSFPIYATLLLILQSLMLTAQTPHQDSINSIVSLLAKEDTMTIVRDEKSHKGMYYKFNSKNAILLSTTATKEDLITLTKNPSPTVRAYSIYYLTQTYSDLPFINLIKEHLNDMETVRFMQVEYPSDGGPMPVFPTQKVGELFVNFIGCTNSFSNGSAYSGFALGGGTVYYKPYLKIKKDLEKVDSILICTPNQLTQTDRLLCMDSPNENYYKSVRKQVEEKQNPTEVIYLSKYKKNEDADLILNNLPAYNHKYPDGTYRHFAAFLNFQHPKLFRYLSDSMKKYYQDPFYLDAISGYRNKESLLLFQKVLLQADADSLKKDRKYLITQEISNSLKKNFIAIYAPLLFTLLEENPGVFSNVPAGLWKADADRTYKYFLKCLNGAHSGYYRADAFGRILTILLKDAPDYMGDYLVNNLQPGLDYGYFKASMKYIYSSKDEKYVLPLIELIKKETDKVNANVEVKILEGFNIPIAKQKLENLFMEHPELKPLPETETEAVRRFKELVYETTPLIKN